MESITGIIWGSSGIVVFFILILFLRFIIKVTLPDKITVVNGRKVRVGERKLGFTVVKGRTHLIPYLEHAEYLDLEVHPINVRVEGVNSANGITVGADATACVCIDDDDNRMLYSAVERLMGKNRKNIREQIQQTLVGNFRGALNKATPLQAIGMQDNSIIDDENTGIKEQIEESDRAVFRNELLTDINSDLSSFGMKVVSVSLQKIWDTSNYIANLAQKTLAQKRQEVEIEEARLRAKAEKIASDSQRKMIVAKNEADEKIIAARQKVELFKKESEALIKQASLEADNKITEAQNKGRKEIETEQVVLRKLQNQTLVIIKAKADQIAADIISQGEGESVKIVEETKNKILKQKMDLLEKSGSTGKMVLFLQQLHHLFESYQENARELQIDSLIVMDEEQGLNGAVNRGPAAFVDFLKHFERGMGINIKEMLGISNEQKKEGDV